MTRRTADISASLDRLRTAAEALGRPVAFMEVCGTHTVSAFRCGLHSLMPANVKLLSGPGCPVCVTAQGDIDLLIELGGRPDVTLCTYGDMLRVTGATGSLEQARGRGAQVRVIYSTLDAVKLAAAEPARQVVLAAVGFETTTPATAAAILEAHKLGLDNFTVLARHKLVIPAMLALLESRQINIQGFLCPGHVSVIIGAEAYRPVLKYGLPCVIAGFEPEQMALAMARLVELTRDGETKLENLYAPAVTPEGNRIAQRMTEQVFEPADVRWRGLGTIPQSGLAIRAEFERFDAMRRYDLSASESPEPAGCRCGEVITGRCTPAECGLFANVCTPTNPVGPCMVSSEGTCHAWFKYNGQRPSEQATERRRGVAV